MINKDANSLEEIEDESYYNLSDNEEEDTKIIPKKII